MTLKSPLNRNEFLDDWSQQSEETECAPFSFLTLGIPCMTFTC